jgi:hypothetical protein
MSYGEWIALAVAVLTGVLVVVFWVRTRPASVEAAAASIRDASEVAQTAVAAAEQLWRTGKLPKTERFDYALGLLQKEFPGLDPIQLRASVEAGVYWLKMARPAASTGYVTVGGTQQPEAAQGLPVRQKAARG